MSRTEITYLDSHRVQVANKYDIFVCAASEFNRQHNGVWNSAVMSFVPVGGGCLHQQDDYDIFSDGTPVDHYEPTYHDHSGHYFENCVVCGVTTRGSQYCGTSCEAQDSDMEGWPV